ncbi:acyltransferase [uncultured Muribaculum sp.]|uniref:acyltransferase family protein n=1 Tax=uncultured Muribaculum sp. TaxID=1918613 RepID=UPI0026125365|nr:acyltransferase [uncultured Muribaculum sp.]
MGKTRQSNFELLRIIAMVMVLFVHATTATFKGYPTHDICASSPFQGWLRCELGLFGVQGVNIFVLISGWFGITLNVKRITGILFQVVFYRVLIGICFMLITSVSAYTILYDLIPGNHDWFTACYLIMVIFTPPINEYISENKQKSILFVIILTIFQIIFGWIFPVWKDYNHGYSAISFLILYTIGRILRNEYDNYRPVKRPGVSLAKLLGFIVLLGSVIFSIDLFVTNEKVCGLLGSYVISYASPVNITIAICFIFIFSQFTISNKVINILASSAFSVYLIHENPLIRPYYHGFARQIWELSSPIANIAYLILLVSGTYLICFAIDRIRILIWEKILATSSIERISHRLGVWSEAIASKFIK